MRISRFSSDGSPTFLQESATVLPSFRGGGEVLIRKFIVPGIAALVLGISPAGSVASGLDKPPVSDEPPRSIKADLDGDKIFDDLEARLARAGSGDLIDVILRLDRPATLERVAALESVLGKFAVSHRFSLIKGFAGTLTKAQVEAVTRLQGVVHVEENSTVRASNDTAQSSFGVTKARADASGLDGDGDGSVAVYTKDDLVAAVIDTGIDPNHLDLDEGKVLAFKDFVNGRTSAYDDNGHGTHVAATIAGEGDARSDLLYKGVAPGGALVGVKVLNSQGSGTMANVAAGIEWVITNKDTYGIEAINLSLGASGCADGTDSTSAAVNKAHDAGIVVAVAAGNEGPGACTIGSPGAAAKAVTVGAMADMQPNGFKQAYFSSRGPTADGRLKPDVSGPGVSITSAKSGTTTGYTTYSGTSMAAPFTAGVALLMKDANSALTPQQVKDKIMQTAVDWARGGNNKTAGSSGTDIDYGAGRLDAYAAIKAAGASISSAPAMPTHAFYEGSLPGTGASVDYKLDVTDTQYPIAATMILPAISGGTATSPDFDLYLYNPGGSEVARAYTSRRQEDLGYKPTATGTYTLRVKSYNGSGGYLVDVSAGAGPDTTAPTISSVSPADGATGVAVNANVSMTFSETMDTAATQAAFSLVKSSDSSSVAGGFSWSGNTMTFDPSGDLEKGVEYTAKMTTEAKDTAGNALAAEKVWKFTVTTLTTVTASPGSTTIESGTHRSGSASSLSSDNNVFYEVNSTTSNTKTTSWYGTFTGISNGLSNLRATYSGKNSASCTQTIAIWRWTDSTWVQLDSRSVGTTEVLVANLAPSGGAADYVSGTSGNGDVRVRIRCTRSWWQSSFYASGDLLKIVHEA
jgi:serine protease AprX